MGLLKDSKKENSTTIRKSCVVKVSKKALKKLKEGGKENPVAPINQYLGGNAAH